MNTWLTFLANVRSDATYALRRLTQTKIISAAAILSLALAAGACVTAFRLIEAVLLRPLPVASPERLFAVEFRSPNIDESRISTYGSNSYPSFERMKPPASKWLVAPGPVRRRSHSSPTLGRFFHSSAGATDTGCLLACWM